MEKIIITLCKVLHSSRKQELRHNPYGYFETSDTIWTRLHAQRREGAKILGFDAITMSQFFALYKFEY